MAFEVGEPSHAREEAAARQQRPSWVALSTIPIVVGANDERAKKIDEAGTDLRLDLHHPPRPTHLVVPKRLALGPSRPPHPLPAIPAAGPSARLLFSACQEEGTCDAEYFLLDAHTRSGARLPAVPADLGVRLQPPAAQRGPRRQPAPARALHRGAAEPAVGHPLRDSALLLHGDDGVGDEDSRLVPDARALGIARRDSPRRPPLKRRFVRPSEGKLYFVEVRGIAAADGQECPGVWIWSLVDSDRAPNWSLDFVASFADIWIDASYIAAGLTPGNVPALALLDPTDHGVVFFFEGASLFGLDVRAGRVVACKHECYLDQSNRDDTKFQFSRFVDAWEIPPFPYSELSSDGGPGKAPAVLLKGNKGNTIKMNQPNPLNHLLPPPLPPQVTRHAVPPSTKARRELEGGMEKTQGKLTGEVSRKSRKKLLRERDHIRLLMKTLYLADEEEEDLPPEEKDGAKKGKDKQDAE
ncbi:unnamed protein product [Urochloa decumbens]|uniref:DUF1618 domain-containing protein n=1 Tax=Urochloa decumbens TaxID=240449 RepID=A0ABC8Z0K6_9POAL